MDGICYQERAGHCTRCWEKFGGNLTAYMVWERTVWEAIGESCIHQDKWTPVCDACASPKELAATTKHATCAGCGQRLMVCPNAAISTCSNRCAQRRRRARRRTAARAVCDACNLVFTPKRSDARFCSDACRQRAYRERWAAGPGVRLRKG
jgi:hypothetical protein